MEKREYTHVQKLLPEIEVDKRRKNTAWNNLCYMFYNVVNICPIGKAWTLCFKRSRSLFNDCHQFRLTFLFLIFISPLTMMKQLITPMQWLLSAVLSGAVGIQSLHLSRKIAAIVLMRFVPATMPAMTQLGIMAKSCSEPEVFIFCNRQSGLQNIFKLLGAARQAL